MQDEWLVEGLGCVVHKTLFIKIDDSEILWSRMIRGVQLCRKSVLLISNYQLLR